MSVNSLQITCITAETYKHVVHDIRKFVCVHLCAELAVLSHKWSLQNLKVKNEDILQSHDVVRVTVWEDI